MKLESTEYVRQLFKRGTFGTIQIFNASPISKRKLQWR